MIPLLWVPTGTGRDTAPEKDNGLCNFRLKALETLVLSWELSTYLKMFRFLGGIGTKLTAKSFA